MAAIKHWRISFRWFSAPNKFSRAAFVIQALQKPTRRGARCLAVDYLKQYLGHHGHHGYWSLPIKYVKVEHTADAINFPSAEKYQ